jgi:2-methylcitrate dehydratase
VRLRDAANLYRRGWDHVNHVLVSAALAAGKLRGPAALALREQLADTTHIGWTILGRDPEKWRPATRKTADHSLPYTVARVLVDGNLTPSSYGPAALTDPAVAALMARVEVREDPALTAMPPTRIPNRVTTLTEALVVADDPPRPPRETS